jgi:diguanylate cyclase (GGDEF)-like protein/PAS domain S-box-containing protein
MKKRSEPPDWDALQKKVVGLGEQSYRKSYFLQLQDRLAELERSRAVLRAERDRTKLYLDTVPAIVVALDREGLITMINLFGCALLGYGDDQLLGRNWFATCLPQPEGLTTIEPWFRQLLEGQLPERDYSEHDLVTAKGERVLVAWRSALLRDHAGQVIGVLSAGEDITERRATERALHNLAFFDPLTGLPNRRLLMDRLQQSMAASARSHEQQALVFLDLDHFKNLNDTQGHDVGDLLLKETAARLHGCVREGDTVSRLGGDEFVVLLVQLSQDLEEAVMQAEMVADKIVAGLGQPYDLRRQPYSGTVSVGVVMFAGHTLSLDELLKRADLAMYQAKAAGRNKVRFFDPAMQASVNARIALENDLRRALANDELVLHYQPQVDASGTCSGVEALLRWQSPSRGLVSPGDFIPLAEETGLILPIGRWALAEACADLADWRDDPALAGLGIAVNVSAVQFREPDFVDDVRRLIERNDVAPERLKIEITESVLVKDVEDVIAKMLALRQIGVSFSLDDFGTGYSSLSYVKRLPLEQIKIDRSFVRDVMFDPNDAAICRAIIALGRTLGLRTVAEGVEDAEQWSFLVNEGCDSAQGYLYARPMTGEALHDWRQHSA